MCNFVPLLFMIKQLKFAGVLIFFSCSFTVMLGQVFDPISPTKTSDTTRAKIDTTSTKPKSRIHPLTTYPELFFERSSDFEQRNQQKYVAKTKNVRDTVLYKSYLPDTSRVKVNQYRDITTNTTNLVHWNLGEPGSPQYNGYHSVFWGGLARIGCNPFSSQIIASNATRFYRAFAPFTEFNYLQGPGKTIALTALHTQNFRPGWNVTLDYRSIINQEQYIGSGQNNQFRNIKLGSLYQSTNNKYKQVIALTWNRSRRNETGGLSNDTQFFIPQPTNQWGLRTLGYYNPVLSTAASNFKQLDHYIEHRYYLKPQLAVTQSVNYQRQIFQYRDSKRDTGFYGNRYFDQSNKTLDSHVWHVFTHKAGLVYHARPTHCMPFNLGFDHIVQSQGYVSKQTSFVKPEAFDPVSHSVGFNIKQSKNITTNFIPSLNYQYTLRGYGKGANFCDITVPFPILIKRTSALTTDIDGVMKVSDSTNIDACNIPQVRMRHFLSATAKFDHQWQPVSLQQQAFYSNHFLYNRSLMFTGNNQYGLVLNYLSEGKKQQKIATPTHSHSNSTIHHSPQESSKFLASVYLNQGEWLNPTLSIDSVPVNQFSNAKYQGFEAILSYKSNKFIFTQHITYKEFKSNQINTLFNYGMPLWTSNTSIQYKTPAFHHAMDLTLGMEIQYTSKFQTTTYRPDAATFVIDSRKTESGNYFELDLFAVARVQTVDVFVKAEHINEILILPGFNPRYQYISGYPIQPYRIRFGINWKFYN